MTHKAIKRFQLDGIIGDDADLPRLHEQHFNMIINQMRYDGYVQLLDVEPAFSIEYDKTKQNYKFLLTVQGVYVGKVKAKSVYGISKNREVPIK